MSEEQDKAMAEAEAAAFVDATLRAQKKQADILIEIAKRGELFHSPDGVAYADIYRNGHRETYPVRSGDFRKWLQLCYYNENDDSAPNKDALSSAIGVIEAQATFDGKEYPVAVRVGGHDDKIYLDLCNDDWQAIEIDADGWRLEDQSPIRFIRSSGMLPLPMPVKKGKTKDGINALRKFINIKDGADFSLVKAWVLGAFYDHGPYPVLALIAQHRAAKSTILKILRALVDPNAGNLRSPQRNPGGVSLRSVTNYLGWQTVLKARFDPKCNLAPVANSPLHHPPDPVMHDGRAAKRPTRSATESQPPEPLFRKKTRVGSFSSTSARNLQAQTD